MYKKILKEILSHKNEKKAKILSRFFKTDLGQYSEGDKFLGITVPESRKIAQKYGNLALPVVSQLLKNQYHEVRLIALLILVHKYKKLSTVSHRSDLWEIVSFAKVTANRRKIVEFYLKNTKYINNWDLVDLSAHYIVGDYLVNIVRQDLTTKRILKKLAKSDSLWERRIAIISTFTFIYNKGESKWTFKIVKMLIKDKHDLIHKACGWMLREVGKRVSDRELTLFLDVYGPQMPRTMLRYAIERLSENKRKYYLNK